MFIAQASGVRDDEEDDHSTVENRSHNFPFLFGATTFSRVTF